jgi:hypothetical protein
VSATSGYLGCDLCLRTIEGQMTEIQYSRGAFVYGQSQVRVTPDPTRLRDVQVCTACSGYLSSLLDYLIAQRGRPARPASASPGG